MVIRQGMSPVAAAVYAKTKSFTGGGTDTFAYGYVPVGNRTPKVLGGTRPTRHAVTQTGT